MKARRRLKLKWLLSEVSVLSWQDQTQDNEDYERFDPADYVDNPVALARIQAGITQEDLAKLMGVTQAYVSKIESQNKVTAKLLNKVHVALKGLVS